MNIAHVASYFLARAIPGLISFAAIAIYSRILRPADYGEFALGLVWAGILGTILFQWLRSGLLRFYAEQGADDRALLSTVCSTYAVVAAALLLPAIAWHLFLGRSQGSEFVLLILFLVAAQGLLDLATELANARQWPFHYGALAGTKALIGLILGSFLVVLWGLGPEGPVLGLALGALLSVFAFGRALWQHAWPIRISGQLLASVLRYGLPLSLAGLLYVAVHGADRILIAHFLGPADVGTYAAGFDLAQQSLGLLMAVLNLAYVPGIFRSYETRGVAVASQSIRRYGVSFMAIVLPATVGLALLAQNIAAVFLGTHFRGDASLIMPIVAIAILLGGTKAFYFDVAFQLAKQTSPLLFVGAAMVSANIVLNILLIPSNGTLGAAYACVISYALGLAASAIWTARVFPMPIWDFDLAKIALATLALALSLLPIAQLRGPASLIIQILVGSLVYLGVMTAVRFKGLGLESYRSRE